MGLLRINGERSAATPLAHGQFWPVLRRGLLWMLALSGLLIALAGGTYLYIQRDGNFHVVEQGLMYRSAQMSGQDLRDVLVSHGIKSVVNLRGGNAGQPWYDDEVRVTRAAGIEHLDIRLSAYKELSEQQMSEIVKLIEQAPKPVLVHCESGADRTGLVSALFRMSRGQGLQLAQQELSPRYGHFPYLLSRSGAMDRSLLVYAESQHPSP